MEVDPRAALSTSMAKVRDMICRMAADPSLRGTAASKATATEQAIYLRYREKVHLSQRCLSYFSSEPFLPLLMMPRKWSTDLVYKIFKTGLKLAQTEPKARSPGEKSFAQIGGFVQG